MNEKKVVELFAGVGGFRLGLERSSNLYKTIWANQWEPGKKVQHAYDCYVKNFGDSQSYANEDIALAKNEIPSDFDLLVGGFPCQDYSVARTNAKGIAGKKGVLWWEIDWIIENRRPPFIILENVDRLLKSPASRRGRDFGIMLRNLHDKGYAVEWRVINAADYGFPQKRRRIFIFGFHKSTSVFKKLSINNMEKWLVLDGLFSKRFPVQKDSVENRQSTFFFDSKWYKDLVDVSNFFTFPFNNSGILHDGRILTSELKPVYKEPIKLREIVEKGLLDEKFFLGKDLEKWAYMKGAKKEPREKPNGEKYFYTEGAIPFPDSLDSPARTILTSESSSNRSTHVITDPLTGRLRLLTPIECERINQFPDNWTNTGMPEKTRYFMMGNALVVGVIERIGQSLIDLMQ